MSRCFQALAMVLSLAVMASAMSHEEASVYDIIIPEEGSAEEATLVQEMSPAQKHMLTKAIHQGATLQKKFFDQANANKALAKHLSAQKEHASLLKETDTSTSVPLTLPQIDQLKSPGVHKCLDLPEVPAGLGNFAQKAKITQKKLNFHYAQLCASEIKEKHVAKEQNSKKRKQVQMHYKATLEKSEKASAYANEVFTKSKKKEAIEKKKNHNKISALKAQLEKAQEVSTKQGSVKHEKSVKTQSNNQEKTTKYVAENGMKEKAKKRACDTEVKALKESLSKKKKIGAETKSKIYEKWSKHLKAEKDSKAAEKQAKQAKKIFAEAARAKEKGTKSAKEEHAKKTAESKSKQEKAKEKDNKQAEEEHHKEKAKKGKITALEHKKEIIYKEIVQKKTHEQHVKEKVSKTTSEKKVKQASEGTNKKKEKIAKRNTEKLTKQSAEHSSKAAVAESKIKPEINHKEAVSKESNTKSKCKNEVEQLKQNLKKANEVKEKATGKDKEKSEKCEVNVKSAQHQLEVKFRSVKLKSKEVRSKVEFNVKTEKKDKKYLKNEKKEKSFEAGYKWYQRKKAEKSQKAVAGNEQDTKKHAKVKAAENLNKKLATVETEAANKVSECKKKTEAAKEQKGKSAKKMLEDPFSQAEEMTTKIRKMKEVYLKTKDKDEAQMKALTKERSAKFEGQTKAAYAKEAAGKAALQKKQEQFKKSCSERKLKMKQLEKREFAKMEHANKELCGKTRATSEANNKKSVALWEKTISTLEGHCKAAQHMEKKKRKIFVNAVCAAITKDVKSTVSLDTKKILQIVKNSKLSKLEASSLS